MSEPLPPPERDHAWLGAHLFFEGDIYSDACDRVVLEVAAPLVERLGARWFFLRFGDDGPHVRLRVLAPAARLAGDVRPAIEQAAAAAPLVRRLAFVAYEPEVERYGGPDGVALAEELFHHSSETALALLHKMGAGRSARLGKALLAMLVQMHTFCDPGTDSEVRGAVAKLAEDYAQGYLKTQISDADLVRQWLTVFEDGFQRQAERLGDYVEAAWQALADDEPLTAELDRYRDRMGEMAGRLRRLCEQGRLAVDGGTCREWTTVTRRILASYLHMMNNRLGVSIREECYLAVLIHQILGAETAPGRGPAA